MKLRVKLEYQHYLEWIDTNPFDITLKNEDNSF